jgi:hypothetical protein
MSEKGINRMNDILLEKFTYTLGKFNASKLPSARDVPDSIKSDIITQIVLNIPQ